MCGRNPKLIRMRRGRSRRRRSRSRPDRSTCGRTCSRQFGLALNFISHDSGDSRAHDAPVSRSCISGKIVEGRWRRRQQIYQRRGIPFTPARFSRALQIQEKGETAEITDHTQREKGVNIATDNSRRGGCRLHTRCPYGSTARSRKPAARDERRRSVGGVSSRSAAYKRGPFVIHVQAPPYRERTRGRALMAPFRWGVLQNDADYGQPPPLRKKRVLVKN